MCGRYALKIPQALATAFDLNDMPDLPPRYSYNIAPTQDIAIIRAAAGGQHLSQAHWGLIPAWACGSSGKDRIRKPGNSFSPRSPAAPDRAAGSGHSARPTGCRHR